MKGQIEICPCGGEGNAQERVRLRPESAWHSSQPNGGILDGIRIEAKIRFDGSRIDDTGPAPYSLCFGNQLELADGDGGLWWWWNDATTTPAVAVSITTPTSAQTVPVNGTLAITAAVANTTNTAVTWTVNGVTNGNSTYGTITGTGLTVTYNAPAAVPATATFNITATSQADTTKSASVSVTISAVVVVSRPPRAARRMCRSVRPWRSPLR